MLNFRVVLATVVASATFALTACGGGGNSSGTANVRLVNATSTHSSLTLLFNGNTAVSGAALDTVSNYAGVDAGSPALQVNDTTTGSALTTLAPSVTKDAHYALIAYESGGTVRTTVIAEDTAAPSSGIASVRLFDAATDAGAVDVYVTDPNADITASRRASASVPRWHCRRAPSSRSRPAPIASASPAPATAPTCGSTCVGASSPTRRSPTSC